MKKTIVMSTALCAFSLPFFAADPAGFALWRDAEQKNAAKQMASKGKLGTHSLGEYGNHRASLTFRSASGEGEIHEHVVDFLTIQSGEATIVVGGKMPNAKKTAPGEYRAAAIEGGTKHKLMPGDTVHVPANTPHQFLLEPGKTVSYFVVKVDVPAK